MTALSKYRLGVGIMLLNSDNLVFIGRRADEEFEAWQMPQGGIDDGEAPKDAVFRELYEETGILNTKVEIIAETKDWYQYEVPEHLALKVWNGRYVGQKQKWFLARFQGVDGDININMPDLEFKAWKWVEIEKLTSLVIHFKQDLYSKVIQEFQEALSLNLSN